MDEQDKQGLENSSGGAPEIKEGENAAPLNVEAAASPVSIPQTPQTISPVLSAPGETLHILTGEEAEREMRRISRRSFLWAGVAIAGVLGGQHWLNTRRADNGTIWPLRRVLEINEQINRDYFREARLAPTFPRAQAGEPPASDEYNISMDDDFDPAEWHLSVEGFPDAEEPLKVTLADLKKLPKTEVVTELKCIEGWSQVVQWAGVRFADFIAHYWPKDHPISEMPQYVGMETPSGAYYVGLDKESAMHPQTLLCYELGGKPLADTHGAPLRLVIPLKYGIKHIKRIGIIRLTDARPKDYWAEQGYDWYAGH